jgi:hypothetical protein
LPHVALQAPNQSEVNLALACVGNCEPTECRGILDQRPAELQPQLCAAPCDAGLLELEVLVDSCRQELCDLQGVGRRSHLGREQRHAWIGSRENLFQAIQLGSRKFSGPMRPVLRNLRCYCCCDVLGERLDRRGVAWSGGRIHPDRGRKLRFVRRAHVV